MTRNLRRNMKPGDESVPIPESQVLVYQICKSCDQQYPLDKFEQRGRPKADGTRHVDDVCKYCRVLHEKGVKRYIQQHSQRVDEMMLNLCESMAAQPMTDFDDLPNIGTLTQEVLRPFGGAQGIALQMAGTFLSSPPGSAQRQKILSLIVKMDTESSKLGYTKKTMEQMTDDELEEYMASRERKYMRLADAEPTREIEEEVESEEEAARRV